MAPSLTASHANVVPSSASTIIGYLGKSCFMQRTISSGSGSTSSGASRTIKCRAPAWNAYSAVSLKPYQKIVKWLPKTRSNSLRCAIEPVTTCMVFNENLQVKRAICYSQYTPVNRRYANRKPLPTKGRERPEIPISFARCRERELPPSLILPDGLVCRPSGDGDGSAAAWPVHGSCHRPSVGS